MDWRKAKTVLILSFLLLNLLLGYQLWLSSWVTSDSSQDIKGLKEEVDQMLLSKGITLEAEIPAKTPKLRQMTLLLDDQSNGQDLIGLNPSVKSSILESKSIWARHLKAQIPHVEDYEPDPALSSDGVYVMNQMHDHYPIFDVNLRLYYDKEHIFSFSQTYAEEAVPTVESPQVKEQRVLSAYIALSSLIENYLQAGSVIKDVRLGYHGQIYNETLVVAPFWRVALANGELFYVHAPTGAVEQKEK